jgi:transcription elongation factor Elf1
VDNLEDSKKIKENKMGWYGGDKILCPKCGEEKANEIYRNNCLESYYLVCSNCGLHLYCEYKEWVTSASYIDESVINIDLSDHEISLEDRHERDEDWNHKNDDIFPLDVSPWNKKLVKKLQTKY